MATSVPIAPQAAAPSWPTAPPPPPGKTIPVPVPAQASPTMALVPGSQTLVAEPPPGIPKNSPAMRLKVELEVGVPVGNFRVRNLLALEPGAVVESRWNYAEDLPLSAGRVQLAWTEFEVADTQLATRLTRLA